jgi:hypothetical protein
MALAREFARDASNGTSLVEKAKELHPLVAGEAARGGPRMLTEATPLRFATTAFSACGFRDVSVGARQGRSNSSA